MHLVIEAPKVIIGLGNPGKNYERTRHNIGFLVLDELNKTVGGDWRQKDTMEISEISINNNKVLLIKPQTFMNKSGLIVPFLTKQGIKPEDMLVVHDELEFPFGKIALKFGGSARGHNGLRSIIAAASDQFARLRFGIGRPERKEDVGDYVLQNFSENSDDLNKLILQAVDIILSLY